MASFHLLFLGLIVRGCVGFDYSRQLPAQQQAGNTNPGPAATQTSPVSQNVAGTPLALPPGAAKPRASSSSSILSPGAPQAVQPQLQTIADTLASLLPQKQQPGQYNTQKLISAPQLTQLQNPLRSSGNQGQQTSSFTSFMQSANIPLPAGAAKPLSQTPAMYGAPSSQTTGGAGVQPQQTRRTSQTGQTRQILNSPGSSFQQQTRQATGQMPVASQFSILPPQTNPVSAMQTNQRTNRPPFGQFANAPLPLGAAQPLAPVTNPTGFQFGQSPAVVGGSQTSLFSFNSPPASYNPTPLEQWAINSYNADPRPKTNIKRKLENLLALRQRALANIKRLQPVVYPSFPPPQRRPSAAPFMHDLGTISQLNAARDLDCETIPEVKGLNVHVYHPMSCDDDICPPGKSCRTLHGVGMCCPSAVTSQAIQSKSYFGGFEYMGIL